jgi:hypothetical protein
LNGKINYPIGNCNVDILLEDKIVCEYDGGGHNLGLKLHTISEEESISMERRRNLFLKSEGYSIIRIISEGDLLPEDAVIVKMIEEAKTYLKTGHSWIEFNIGKRTIKCKKFQSEYEFGKLRKIMDSPQRVPKIREKTIQTNMERYGFSTPAQNEQVQEKTEKTNLERYGVKTPFQNSDIKEKIIETNLERYGVDNPAKAEEIKTKIRATTFKKFGVESLLQLKEIRDKGFEILKKSLFRYKGEIALIEYLKVFDPNVCSQVEHPEVHNIMDYYLPLFDLWGQYDGDYWHGRIPRALNNNKVKMIVGYDKYQKENVPNLIRFWESDVKKAIKEDTILDLIENKIKEKLIELK